MKEKIFTADEIFTLIDNQTVNKEMGINLIENYGLRQQQEAIEKLQKAYGRYSAEVEAVINRISAQLDELLKNTMEVIN